MDQASDKSSGISIEIIKFIIGGVVAAGLLAAWVIGYFEPILLKKYELMSLENAKVSMEHQMTELSLQKASLALEDENEKIRQELTKLIEKNEALRSELAQAADAAEKLKNTTASIQKTYLDKIQTAATSRADRQKLLALEKQSSRDIEILNQKISQLQTAKQDLADNIMSLEKDLADKTKLSNGTLLLGGRTLTNGETPLTPSTKNNR